MEQENLQQAEELNNNEPISPDTLNDETQEEVSVQGQPTPIEKAPEKEVPAWDTGLRRAHPDGSRSYRSGS